MRARRAAARVSPSASPASGSARVPDHEDLVPVVVDLGGPVNQPSGSRPANQPWSLAAAEGTASVAVGVVLGHGDYIITSLRRVQRRIDVGHRGRLGVVGVLRAGPEEAPEAVLPAARHGVDVEVRDALAHHVVLGDEGALRCRSRPAPRPRPAAPGRTARRAWRRRGRAGSRRGRGARPACGPGNSGRWSRKATTVGVSSTRSAGISPPTIEQKRQGAAIAGQSARSTRRATRTVADAASPRRAWAPSPCGGSSRPLRRAG